MINHLTARACNDYCLYVLVNLSSSTTVNYSVLKMLYTTIKEFYLDHTLNLFHIKIKSLVRMIQSTVTFLFF